MSELLFPVVYNLGFDKSVMDLLLGGILEDGKRMGQLVLDA